MGGGGEWPDRGPAGSSELSLRKANAADLDAIADIIQAGWPDDPSCDYRYPGRKKYPDEFWTWTRREYQSYLEAQDKYVVLVMTAPVIEAIESEEGGGRPVAVGVWDVCVQKDSPPGSSMNFLCAFAISIFETRHFHHQHQDARIPFNAVDVKSLTATSSRSRPAPRRKSSTHPSLLRGTHPLCPRPFHEVWTAAAAPLGARYSSRLPPPRRRHAVVQLGTGRSAATRTRLGSDRGGEPDGEVAVRVSWV